MNMKAKYILILLLLLLFVSILPIYPLDNVVKTDPADTHDPRIKVEISKNHLNYIISTIRKKKRGNLYTLLFGLTKNRNIYSIAEFKKLAISSNDSEHLEKEIIVFTASDTEKKNHEGLLYFFKVNGDQMIFENVANIGRTPFEKTNSRI